MSGWLKLHRAFSEWEWSDEPNMVALFIHLLLTANFEDKNWKGIPVKKGQLIAGRKKMSEATGISEQGIRTCLDRLRSTKEVTISSVSKYSIITITNWEKYQDTNQISNHEVTSNQPATNQQLTTPKELKKEISKERKTIISYSLEFETFWRAFPKRSGSSSKPKSFSKYKSIIKSGVPHDDLLWGAQRYFKFCDETDKLGTEFVRMATTWLNDDGWLNDWRVTNPKQETTKNIFDEIRERI